MLSNFERKLTTVPAALKRIHRGGRIFIGSGCAEPQTLALALVALGLVAAVRRRRTH